MDRQILFEGKTAMGGRDVDLKIYKVKDEEGCEYYEWDYNPYLVDENQMDVHIGEIMRADTLEHLFCRLNSYKSDIRKIKEVRTNSNF